MAAFQRAVNAALADGGGACAKPEYPPFGPKLVLVEDRLTDLIDRKGTVGMTGFREALMTQVLRVLRPDDYLRSMIYSGSANSTGKREIAERVFGLALPKLNQSTMRIGGLAKRSNGLLLELLGDGFETLASARPARSR